MSYPESANDLLQAAGTGILSTRTPDGKIQSTAVWYLFEDGDLKISLSDARKKVRNLQADPTATFFLLDPTNQFHFLEIRGTASLAVDEGNEFLTRVGVQYGTDMSTFDGPDDTRYIATLVPERINAR
jgi:PPOX class probable F420-dependent enzyme